LNRKFKALLLAGGKSKHALRKVTGQEYKALMTIESNNSQPIINHMIKVLQNTKYISQVLAAAPIEVHQQISSKNHIFTPSGLTLMDTLKLNMPHLQDEPHILVITCDLPLVLSKHVEHFMADCLANPGFDVYYSIIDKQAYIRLFPDHNLRRIYANLTEGSFTGGNVFLINPSVIIDCSKIIEQFILFRKHPLKMATILGRRFLTKYLKKYLSIRDLEKLVPHYLKGYTGKAILADPEIALDLDKPIQLEALKMFGKN
jgi:molybdopterin-guanine dinucleotide biosynthesis protein A